MEWITVGIQVGGAVVTIVGVIATVANRFARIEGRIENLGIEIRKDRELVEHRIRQLEFGLGQVRTELARLAYSVGHRMGREDTSKQEAEP